MSSFLTASWNKLINITYAVAPELLLPHLPKGLELDLIDGKAFVSLVAFEFNDVRLKGIPIPFHRNFPEINLRFYVNYKGRRGVVFIKEFVPRYLVAAVAKGIYNEPYESIAMTCRAKEENGRLLCNHAFMVDKTLYSISANASTELQLPPKESLATFFKEHDLGFGVDSKGNTLAYKVTHPEWEVYDDLKTNVQVDFAKVYGEKWAVLNSATPLSSLMAAGSAVTVYSKMKLSELD